MRVMNHNWSATKQRLHPQSVAKIIIIIIIIIQHLYSAIMSYADTEALVAPVKSE